MVKYYKCTEDIITRRWNWDTNKRVDYPLFKKGNVYDVIIKKSRSRWKDFNYYMKREGEEKHGLIWEGYMKGHFILVPVKNENIKIL